MSELEPPCGKGPPAPPPLDLVQAFVNTRAIHHDERFAHDDLSSPAALAAWWQRHMALDGALPVTTVDLEMALAVREGLRGLLARNNDSADEQDARAVERLDAVAAALPLRVAFDATGEAGIVPVGTGPAREVLAGLLVRTVQAQTDGSWSRLKVCRAADCREAFYDVSRNRSRTWCSMSLCGTRAKHRSFVDRRRNRHAR